MPERKFWALLFSNFVEFSIFRAIQVELALKHKREVCKRDTKSLKNFEVSQFFHFCARGRQDGCIEKL